MRKKPNNKMIGLFIVCGLSLFLATMWTFVSDKIMQSDKHPVVMYFSESIKGLDVGSPVVFKGVSIGKVAKIDIITDLNDLDFSIPVYVAFNEQKITSRQPRENAHQVLRELVKNGLRARLGTQNYLTGQLMIELEFVNASEKPIYRAPKDSKIPEIPTVLSQFAEISQGIQELPLRETVRKFNQMLDNINNDIIPQVNKVVSDFNGVVEDFDVIPDRTKGIPASLNNFNKAVQNISNAAKSFANFADYLERHPESLLRGKGGY
ncbi:MAG: MCE family protein [Alphaproteobacteria bacterium]|nr:MCE family protein [Alphaproteobacteria bacterium]